MTEALPLLNWQKQAEHFRLQEDRERLLARIATLRPREHKRVLLEARVRELTLRQMALENELYRPEGHRDRPS
ncbi:hypothetical protein RHAB21_00701 [Pseudorhizobium halotolerans]|uniref:Transposase n=1 Tax=Pseudorhizobium halotolerans TaxID=1233081 RepID=A0ABN7JZK7_9HYPH|nr:hypothetical protein [Pseudorhizobium halotolerans]CAD7055349.1 hypothetical protein RHAB21_00701 [Pseudorhizobium halotolerans]